MFVLAATNRADLVDSSLLRPGRLDTLVHVGPATEPEKQLQAREAPRARHHAHAAMCAGATRPHAPRSRAVQVLRALTRKFKLADDVDLARVAEASPASVSGADLYGLCAGALLAAIRERAAEEDAAGARAAPARVVEGDAAPGRAPEAPVVCARHFEAAVRSQAVPGATPDGTAARGTPVPPGYSKRAAWTGAAADES